MFTGITCKLELGSASRCTDDGTKIPNAMPVATLLIILRPMYDWSDVMKLKIKNHGLSQLFISILATFIYICIAPMKILIKTTSQTIVNNFLLLSKDS